MGRAIVGSCRVHERAVRLVRGAPRISRSRHLTRSSGVLRWLRVGRIAGVLGFALVVWLVASGSIVLALRWIEPPFTAVMLEQPLPLAKLDYRWVARRAIASTAARAAMAAEDQRFLDHHGIDFVSLDRALEDYRDGDGRKSDRQRVARFHQSSLW